MVIYGDNFLHETCLQQYISVSLKWDVGTAEADQLGTLHPRQIWSKFNRNNVRHINLRVQNK